MAQRYSYVTSKPGSFMVVNMVVRMMAFVLSGVTLGLTAYMEYGIDMTRQAMLRLAVATAAASTLYLIVIFLWSTFWGTSVVAAPVLFMEIALFALWVASFACLVDRFGLCRGWRFGDGLEGFYWVSEYIKRCDCARVAMAFSFINAIYYFITTVLFVGNVVLVITRYHGSSYLWRPMSSMDATVDRGTCLLILQAPEPLQEFTSSSDSSRIRSEKSRTTPQKSHTRTFMMGGFPSPPPRVRSEKRRNRTFRMGGDISTPASVHLPPI